MKTLKTLTTLRPRLLLGAGAALTILAAPRTQAASYSWNSASTALWSQSAKWTPSSGTPGAAAGDTATINQAGAYACILDYTPANALSGLTMQPASGDVKLIVSNATLTSSSWTLTRAGLVLTNGGRFYLQGSLQPMGNDNNILVGGGDGTSIFDLNGNDVLMPQAHNGHYRNNTITIDANGSITNVGNVNFGFNFGWSQGYVSDQNVLRVQNGGRLTVRSRGLHIGRQYSGPASSSNTLLIASGGTVTSLGGIGRGLAIGYLTTLANQLIVTNGGKLFTADNSYVGVDDKDYVTPSIGNAATVTGDGSLWDAGGGRVFVGSMQYSMSNSLTVTAGGIVSNAWISFGNTDVAFQGGGPRWSRFTVTDGGRVYSRNGGFQPAGNNNSVYVGGGTRASLWDLGGNQVLMPQAIQFDFTNLAFTIDALGVVTNTGALGFNLGWTQGKISSDNRLTVMNGGQLFVNAGNFAVSRYWNGSADASRNAALITTGGRVTVPWPQTVTVGAAGWSNTLFVTDGGLLEAVTLTVDSKAGNVISNRAGVLQFTVPTPAITPGVFGRIGIEDGVVSFRGIGNADVFCNGAGKSLDAATRVSWAGANAFRLDNATNLAGQAYTFATGLGAANFARLELLHGAGYRGNVTVGSGGGLLSSNGMNSVTGNLSMQPGATLSVDLDAPATAGLAVTGTANFGGAALRVALRRAPERGATYRVVEAAGGVGTQLGAQRVTADFAGQSYTLNVLYDSTGVLLLYPNLGTTVFFR